MPLQATVCIVYLPFLYDVVSQGKGNASGAMTRHIDRDLRGVRLVGLEGVTWSANFDFPLTPLLVTSLKQGARYL